MATFQSVITWRRAATETVSMVTVVVISIRIITTGSSWSFSIFIRNMGLETALISFVAYSLKKWKIRKKSRSFCGLTFVLKPSSEQKSYAQCIYLSNNWLPIYLFLKTDSSRPLTKCRHCYHCLWSIINIHFIPFSIFSPVLIANTEPYSI